MKPCLVCSTPTPNSRCAQHQLPPTPRKGNRSHPHLHTARWQRLSKQLRTRSPFCETCNTTTTLSVDHIIPASERPDLIFTAENLRILCATCNARRSNTCTPEERQHVLDAITARQRRTQRSHETRCNTTA